MDTDRLLRREMTGFVIATRPAKAGCGSHFLSAVRRVLRVDPCQPVSFTERVKVDWDVGTMRAVLAVLGSVALVGVVLFAA
ncbi:MAG: hypothetical protein AAF576_09320, partial [Pseudomonadota bacterium]